MRLLLNVFYQHLAKDLPGTTSSSHRNPGKDDADISTSLPGRLGHGAITHPKFAQLVNSRLRIWTPNRLALKPPSLTTMLGAFKVKVGTKFFPDVNTGVPLRVHLFIHSLFIPSVLCHTIGENYGRSLRVQPHTVETCMVSWGAALGPQVWNPHVSPSQLNTTKITRKKMLQNCSETAAVFLWNDVHGRTCNPEPKDEIPA